MIQTFRSDLASYGLGTALFNVRFDLAYGIAKLLIRRPIHLEVK